MRLYSIMGSFITDKKLLGKSRLSMLYNAFIDIVDDCIFEDLDNFLKDTAINKRAHLTYLSTTGLAVNKYKFVVNEIENTEKDFIDYETEQSINTYTNNIQMFSIYVSSIDKKHEFNYNRDIPLFDYHFNIYKQNHCKLLLSLQKRNKIFFEK